MNRTRWAPYLALGIIFSCDFWQPLNAQKEAAGDLDLDQALRQLDSELFAKREGAMLYLWLRGKEVEDVLRQALETGSPEVQQRIHRVLEAFELGIMPDTPPEVAELIYLFRDGDLNAQREVIGTLSSKEEWRLALQLARSVNDENFRSTLIQTVSAHIDGRLTPLLAQGKLEEARELLEVVASDDASSLRNLGIFYYFTSTLDVALAKAEERPAEWRRLAWLLRVLGRIEESVAIGEKAGNAVWVDSLRASQGDALAFLRVVAASDSEESIEKFGFELAHSRLTGDEAAFVETRKKIEDWANGQENAYLKEYAFEALILNDERDNLLNLLSETAALSVFDAHTGGWELERALQSLGINSERPPYTEWSERVKADVVQDKQGALVSALEFAQYLEGMGEEEEARRIFNELANACRNSLEKLEQIIYMESQTGLHDSLLDHIKLANANGANVLDLIKRVLGGADQEDDSIQRWWDFLRNRFHEKTEDEVLDVLFRLLKPLKSGLQAEEAEEELPDVMDSDPKALIEAAYRTTFAYDENGRAAWLKVLYAACEVQGFEEQARDYLKEWVGIAPSVANLSILGDILLNEEKWEEAASVYEKYWELDLRDPSVLYLSGLAWGKAGDSAKASEAKKRARLLPLGNATKRLQLAETMYDRGDRESAIEEWKLVARTADVNGWDSSIALQHLAREIYEEDPGTAARFQERAILSLMQVRWGFRNLNGVGLRMGTYQALRGRVHEYEALAYAKNNDAAGVARAANAFNNLMPGNSSIAEQIIPALEKVGEQELADQLYAKVHQLCLDACEVFPNSGMVYNNLAWLNARALRNIDEAYSIAQKAVELQPDSAAYVDTLAEVYFVKGDREKAIELSERAVALAPNDQELLGQRERFKSAPIPQRQGN